MKMAFRMISGLVIDQNNQITQQSLSRAIIRASKNNELSDLEYLLEYSSTEFNATAHKSMNYAISYGYSAIVKLLLNKFNYPAKELRGYLISAITYNRIEIVKMLIYAGADKTDLFKLGIIHNNLELLELLVEPNTNVSKEKLLEAFKRNYFNIIPILLEHGGFQYINDALIYSVMINNLEMVEYLVKEGADVNSYNGLPLECASRMDFSNIVNFLENMGAHRRLGYFTHTQLDQEIQDILNHY